MLVYLPLLFACWLIFVQLISPIKFPREPWSESIPLILLCFGPMLSVFWSSSPQKTMTDSVTLLILGLLAIAASKYLTFDDRLKITGHTLAFLIVLSLLVVYFAPSYGVDVDSRAVAWRGIFSNKNSLGRVAAIELLISAFLATQARGGRKALWVGAFLTSLFVLVNTDSQTALLAALVGLAFVAITRLRPWLRHRASPVATVLVGSYFMLSALIPVVGPLVATYVSRDPTLTGRTILWALSSEFADQKALAGWGFGAVWQIEGGVGQTISRSLTFLPGSAHNGLIDLRLQLGIFGVLLFAIGLWVLLVQALGSSTSSSRNAWRLGYVTLLLTMDLTESTFYFGFTWFLAWIFLSGDRNKTWRLT